MTQPTLVRKWVQYGAASELQDEYLTYRPIKANTAESEDGWYWETEVIRLKKGEPLPQINLEISSKHDGVEKLHYVKGIDY